MARTADPEADEVRAEALYAELVGRARALPYYATAWPPKRDRHGKPVGMLAHRIEMMPEKAQTIGRHAAGAAPLADVRLERLLADWLEVKRSSGSEVERSMYSVMDVPTFLQRLLVERPLVFFKSHDEYALRSGETGAGGAAMDLDTEGLDETGRLGGFARVGTDAEAEPLLLAKTLSYDEMALSALLSVATPTVFINDGDRGNQARPQAEGSFEPEGVFTGAVGARFEACEQMEWRHMIVTFEQNTTSKGYGAEADPDAAQTRLLQVWAKFYEIERFPSYEEVQAEVVRQIFGLILDEPGVEIVCASRFNRVDSITLSYARACFLCTCRLWLRRKVPTADMLSYESCGTVMSRNPSTWTRTSTRRGWPPCLHHG
jgi:hypothetical protein